MAVKFASLRRDLKKQNDGDWVPLPELMDPKTSEIPEFRVRGFNYGPFQMARSALIAKLSNRRGPSDPVKTHADEGRLMAQHILLDWRGAAEPYSDRLALEMLTDYASPIQDYVRRCALEVAEVETEYTTDAEGNSAPSSVGKSRPAAVA